MSEASAVQNAKVFVGNLSFKTTDEDLHNLFKESGEMCVLPFLSHFLNSPF